MALMHRWAWRAARLFWKVRRPRSFGVRALAVDGEGRVALVRHTYIPGWYLPGGGVKRGESASAALARELAEEVGITDYRVDRILGVYHSRSEGKDDHVLVFVVRVGEAAQLCRADLIEIEDAAWFPLDGLPEGVSPATARRITEYCQGATGAGNW
jgi:8-oxo-dGTP pyrophosphatase MutT (NUDIX family)